MKYTRVLVLPCLFAAMVVGIPPIASAGNFSMHPRSIVTTSFDRSATLTLVNQSGVSIRLAVAAMHWGRSAAGKMTLRPTDDLLVFPPIVTLAPHETRSLPVTVLAEPSDGLRTYRVQVTDVSEAHGRAHPDALPVFFRTRKP